MKTNLKYIVLDVDGTLTDSGIYYDEHGNEIKKFSTKDGTGIIMAQAAGIEIIVLTGRECAATTRRLSELGVKKIYQDVGNKTKWLTEWMNDNRIQPDELAYIGDDINDLAPMQLCGFVGCPADAAMEVREIASYISPIRGGNGAARDVIEYLLKREDKWARLLVSVYGVGV